MYKVLVGVVVLGVVLVLCIFVFHMTSIASFQGAIMMLLNVYGITVLVFMLGFGLF